MNRRSFFTRVGQAIACGVIAPYMALAPLQPSIRWTGNARAMATAALQKARFTEFFGHVSETSGWTHYLEVNPGPLHADDPYGSKALTEFKRRAGR